MTKKQNDINELMRVLPERLTKDIMTNTKMSFFKEAVYELRTGAYVQYYNNVLLPVKRIEVLDGTFKTWGIDEFGTDINMTEYDQTLKHATDDEYDIIRIFIPDGETLHKIYERPDIERTESLSLINANKTRIDALPENNKTAKENPSKTKYFIIIRTNTDTKNCETDTAAEALKFVADVLKDANQNTWTRESVILETRIQTAIETLLPCMQHIGTISLAFPESRFNINIITTKQGKETV